MPEKTNRDDDIVSIPDVIGGIDEPEKKEIVEEDTITDGKIEDTKTLSRGGAHETDKKAKNSPEEMPKKQEIMARKVNMREWLQKTGWSGSPFTFSIVPSLAVGYNEQLEKALGLLEGGHKLFLIVGPTGSGKTSMLKRIAGQLPRGFDYIYIGKPPEKPDEFVWILNDKFKASWYMRIFRPFISNIKNLYQIPSFLNKKLKNKRLVVMFDEAHESSLDVLEWLRVLSDQVDKMCVIVSGLPVFDEKLNDLETFRKRLASKIELLSLTKEETVEMIKKRIESVGGSGIEPFDSRVLDMIYERTGGFPREVLKVCDDLLNRAAGLDRNRITEDLLMLDIRDKPKAVSLDMIEKMTPMQKEIIERIGRKAGTPGDIANSIDLKKYKSRQHAVRSINNILKVLMNEGLVERKRSDKAFVYHLSPRIKTLVVKA